MSTSAALAARKERGEAERSGARCPRGRGAVRCGAMWRLVYWGFVAVGFALVWLIIMQPGRLRQLGRNARMLGYAYVAAILISAALRLAGFWGT